MHLIQLAKLWLETNIGAAAPYALVTFLIWATYWLSRKFFPTLWTWIDAHSPDGVVASKVVQGLPAVLAGALVTASIVDGDFAGLWKGAFLGASAPFLHELMKRYRGATGKAAVMFLTMGCATFLQVGCASTQAVETTAKRCQERMVSINVAYAYDLISRCREYAILDECPYAPEIDERYAKLYEEEAQRCSKRSGS